MRFIASNQLGYSFKESLIRALTEYNLGLWQEKNGCSNRYTEEHKKDAWVRVYTLLGIAVGSEIYSKFYNCNDYLDYRDSLLKACEKAFVGQHLYGAENEAFKTFVKWVCVGTNFTPESVRQMIHISQYAYCLKERGVWKDEYAYKQYA